MSSKREDIRKSLFQQRKPKRETVQLFGVEFELLQPYLGDFVRLQAELSSVAGDDVDEGTALTLGVDELGDDNPKAEDTEADREVQSQMILKLLVQYAVVPGTDERIFTEEDMDTITQLPYTSEFMVVQAALLRLTSFDLDEAKVNMGNPTNEQSQNTREL